MDLRHFALLILLLLCRPPSAIALTDGPYVFQHGARQEAYWICDGEVQIDPEVAGTYTAVVKACELPVQRAYRLELAP